MSIKISFDDLSTKQGIENVNFALELRKNRMFTDEEIQKMYDEQIEKDKQKEKQNDNLKYADKKEEK